MRGSENGSYVYFVHSYYLKARDESIVAASTEYGCRYPRIGGEWECIRLPVPSGEEQQTVGFRF